MKKTSGITLIESIIAAGLLALLAMSISDVQLFTISSVQRSEFSSVMDAYQLDATTSVQNVNGVVEIRNWVDTSMPDLKSCLMKSHSGCTNYNDQRFPLVTTVSELNTVQFDKSSSRCTTPPCDGQTLINIMPDCPSDSKCDGIKVEVLTQDIRANPSARVKDKKMALYLSSLKLYSGVGIDFSCSEDGSSIIAVDPIARRAICSTSNITECTNGVPNEISGIGLIGGEPCRDMLNFDPKNAKGLGKDTTPFEAGYKGVGVVNYTTPDGPLTKPLAQEACGTTILRRVTLSVGQSWDGRGTCPNSTRQQNTIYRPYKGERKMLYQHRGSSDLVDDVLVGVKRPHDPDPDRNEWGWSMSKEWDFEFAKPASGYSNVEWHLIERCCRERDDVWAPEQLATNFSEIIDVDPYTYQTILKDEFVIDDDAQATTTFRLVDRDGSVMWSQSVNVIELATKRLNTEFLRISDVLAVPGTTALGVANVYMSGDKLYRERVIKPVNETEDNHITYTMNTVTGVTAIESSSREDSNAELVVKYTNKAGAVVDTKTRRLWSSDAKIIKDMTPAYTAVAFAAVEPSTSSTPTGIVDTISYGRGMVQIQIQDPGISPPPTSPTEYEIRLRDLNGVVIRTQRMTLNSGDRIRVGYVLNYTWDIQDPPDAPFRYDAKNPDGSVSKSVMVNPGEHVRLTYELQPQIIDR